METRTRSARDWDPVTRAQAAMDSGKRYSPAIEAAAARLPKATAEQINRAYADAKRLGK